MIVQHNITAMNSNRMLGITTSGQAKSTEKLSSGYKINRAADDAAGLAISEKMRKQIRGLTQASANAQDGISTVQTAEGALGEVQDMLQRMNELAVKAANGTESQSDRKAIQSEIDQLTTEIDRVSETTKFNETYLLKGDKDAPQVASFKYGKFTTDQAGEAKINQNVEDASDKGKLIDSTTGLTATITFDPDASQEDQNKLAKAFMKQGVTISAKAEYDPAKASNLSSIPISYSLELNGSAAEEFQVSAIEKNGDTVFEIKNKSGSTIATAKDVEGLKAADFNKDLSPENPSKQISAVITASDASAARSAGHIAAFYDQDGNKVSENALGNYFSYNEGVANTKASARMDANSLYDALGNKVDLSSDEYKNLVNGNLDQTAALNLKLHVGADATSDNQISLNIDAMSAKGLGIVGMKVDGADGSNALDAIETIKTAINKISGQRSALGAVQNRLEHTIKNLDNVVENTTSAEAEIRDTDMATEMVQYSKNNILAQAGQSMLAQANQSNQGVLSLLG